MGTNKVGTCKSDKLRTCNKILFVCFYNVPQPRIGKNETFPTPNFRCETGRSDTTTRSNKRQLFEEIFFSGGYVIDDAINYLVNNQLSGAIALN